MSQVQPNQRIFVPLMLGLVVLGSAALQAGSYVPVTLYPYKEAQWQYSINFTVEGIGVWEGSTQRYGKFQIVTTATGTDYKALDDDDDWCVQAMIWQPCPVPGRGWGAVYSAPHKEGRTITCRERDNHCAGSGNQRYRKCGWSETLRYWGYTMVYPTTIDRSSLIIKHTGPKKKVTKCIDNFEPNYPTNCPGEWIGVDCCCEVIDLGDGIRFCMEECDPL